MHIDNTKPYWFTLDQIRIIEESKNAKYMGAWCTKRPDGSWTESPADVFYANYPDTSKGHTHYFGVFRNQDASLTIVDGSSAFSKPIIGVLTESGEVLVSRYRHDYVEKDEQMIDGGRDYVRRNTNAQCVKIVVEGKEFKFEKVSDV